MRVSCWRDFLRVVLLVGGLFKGIESINITAVDIPRIIEAGSKDPIVLDCNYELGRSTTESLVIKWFINQDLLYQWIYGMKPQGSKEFKDYIDSSFKASNDPTTMYRAVKLIRPSHELSGNVRCSVSSLAGEAEASREMLVYAPEKDLRLSHPALNKTANHLTVTCLAKDVYPRPTIIIHRDSKPIESLKQCYKNNTDGLYTVEAVAVLPADKVQLPAVFRCEISIPEANYTSAQEYVFNGGDLLRFTVLNIVVGLIISIGV